jgi:hypothetical protein
LEEDARRAFAKDPEGWAHARGLRGAEARLLAGLDAGDVGYFASRRQIDRRAMLAADVPKAAARAIHEGALLAYFRAHPYAIEDPLREAARFAAWARQAARAGRLSAFAADLAAYEAAELRLRSLPARAAKPSARPRRAPRLRLLRFGHDLAPALRARGVPREGAARPCFVVLARTPEGVEGGEVSPLVFHLLRAANGRRSDAEVARAAARLAGRPPAEAARVLAQLRREGALAPRPPNRRA